MEMENMLLLLELLESDDDVDDILSSSSSSSEEESFVINREKRYIYHDIAGFERAEFKTHFRMYPETFEFILSLVGSSLEETSYICGRKPIPAKEQLLLAIWLMATPDSYRSICEKFDIPKATAFRSVRRVTRVLYGLAPRFIKWPKNDAAVQVIQKFERNSGFPGVIGAIDGTHFEIEAPQVDQSSYINRKGYASIQMQAVCTHDLLFTSVYAGHAGCCHDARVFRLSPVASYMDSPEEYFPNNSHLIGDAAYGIHNSLMVPHKNNGRLTERERNYNFCLSSARMAIERAFGVLKARWRRIRNCVPMIKIDKIPEYILATCVLHNICILGGDLIEPEGITLRVVNRGRLTNSVDARLQGVAKRVQIQNNLILRNI